MWEKQARYLLRSSRRALARVEVKWQSRCPNHFGYLPPSAPDLGDDENRIALRIEEMQRTTHHGDGSVVLREFRQFMPQPSGDEQGHFRYLSRPAAPAPLRHPSMGDHGQEEHSPSAAGLLDGQFEVAPREPLTP